MGNFFGENPNPAAPPLSSGNFIGDDMAYDEEEPYNPSDNPSDYEPQDQLGDTPHPPCEVGGMQWCEKVDDAMVTIFGRLYDLEHWEMPPQAPNPSPEFLQEQFANLRQEMGNAIFEAQQRWELTFARAQQGWEVERQNLHSAITRMSSDIEGKDDNLAKVCQQLLNQLQIFQADTQARLLNVDTSNARARVETASSIRGFSDEVQALRQSCAEKFQQADTENVRLQGIMAGFSTESQQLKGSIDQVQQDIQDTAQKLAHLELAHENQAAQPMQQTQPIVVPIRVQVERTWEASRDMYTDRSAEFPPERRHKVFKLAPSESGEEETIFGWGMNAYGESHTSPRAGPATRVSPVGLGA